jgi:hypothetical protein
MAPCSDANNVTQDSTKQILGSRSACRACLEPANIKKVPRFATNADKEHLW